MPTSPLGVAMASAVAMVSLSASATSVLEVEPNDTLPAAQFVANADPSITISGARSFSDFSDDFFSFDVGAGGLLSIVSSSANASADSIMGLYDPNGSLVASNDDAGGSAMSAIQYTVPTGMTGMTGRYSIGFSGYNPGLLSCTATVTACYDTTGDFVFDTFVAGGGSGGSTGFDYQIDVSGVALVPEPGTLALFALGAPLLLGWRRLAWRSA